ncbi:MAG: hypothetical protein ACRDOK_19625, partial [Streptosporangiaceae bacterium]
MIGIVVWSMVVESIVAGLFSSVQPYLPSTAAATLAGPPLGGAAFEPAHDAASSASRARPAGP